MNNNLVYYKYNKEKSIIYYNKALRLKLLDLSYSTIYNIVPLCNIIQNSTNLQSLKLNDIDIKNKSFTYDNHKIKYFDKSSFELLGKAIKSNKSLKKIDISLNSTIKDHTYKYNFDFKPILNGISNNKFIQTLRINQNNLTDIKSYICNVIKSNHIKKLYFAACEIDDFTYITNSMKLNNSITTIWFQEMKITNKKSFDTFYKYLKNTETLTKLDLSVKYIDFNLLAEALKINTNLETLLILRLKNNNVLPLIDALQVNKSLKELEIYRCYNFEGMDELISSLQNNNSLQSLTIADTKLKSVNSICSLIKSNKTLTYLNMYQQWFEESDKILDALKCNSTLKSINLKACNIKNSDKLAEIIKSNKTLEFLNLRCNNLKDLTEICNSLKINDTLQTLILSECFDETLTKDEIKTNNLAFCDMLKYNTGLKTLKYCENELRENIKELIEALQVNTTLTKLKISHNHIPDISILYDSLINNKTLTYLDCFDNYEKHYDKNFDEDNVIINKTINSLCKMINQNRKLQTLYTDEYNVFDYRFNLDKKYIDQLKKALNYNKVLKECNLKN